MSPLYFFLLSIGRRAGLYGAKKTKRSQRSVGFSVHTQTKFSKRILTHGGSQKYCIKGYSSRYYYSILIKSIYRTNSIHIGDEDDDFEDLEFLKNECEKNKLLALQALAFSRTIDRGPALFRKRWDNEYLVNLAVSID